MRNRILGAVALLVVFTVSLAALTLHFLSARRFQTELAQASAHMDSGLYGLARQRLLALHQEQPNDGEVAFRLGTCEAIRGAPENAIDLWRHIIPTSKWSGVGALSAARLAISMGRFGGAEQILRRALDRPLAERLEILHTTLILMVQQGRSEEASRLIESVWRTTREALPATEASKLALLRDHVGLDLEPFPLESNLRTLEQGGTPTADADKLAIALARAHLATVSGNFDMADQHLTEASNIGSDRADVHKARIAWAMATGDLGSVNKWLDRFPSIPLDHGTRLHLRAWLARQRGERANEMVALEQIVKRQPDAIDALSRLAELNLLAGDRKTAIELRNRLAQINSARDRYYRLYKENRYANHLEELSQLARKLGRDFEAAGFHEIRNLAESTEVSAKTRPPLLATTDTESSVAITALDVTSPVPDAQVNLAERTNASRQHTRVHSAPVPLPATGRLEKSLEEASRSVVSDSRAKASASIQPIRPKLETDQQTIPSFQDRSVTAGLSGFVLDNGQTPVHQLPEMACGGVAVLDYDGDGWLDLFCVQGGSFPPAVSAHHSLDRLYRNAGDGTFKDASAASGIASLPGGYGHGVTVGDYDNDGQPDLFITRWRSYALYRNRGDGTFDDRTRESGLGGDRDWPTSSAFADFDNDGDLDLYVCHYGQWDDAAPLVCKDPTNTVILSCDPRTILARPDHLFRNDGGQFVDVTASAGIIDRDGRGFGVVAADFDADGLVDIFVANDSTANYLFRNRGHFHFDEVGHTAGVAANASGGYQAGMGVACGDVDGDGRLDLAVTNYYAESTTLFVNLGDGFFADHTTAAGLAAASRHKLGFGAVFLDSNNDGWLDLITANGHVSDQRPLYPYAMTPQLFLGSAKKDFVDVTSLAGSPFQQEHIGRALSCGDFDRDGRIDVVLIAQNEPIAYLHNEPTPSIAHFLSVQLQGSKSNRDGVGATVTIKAGGRLRTAQRFGGGSYQSASDPRLHFGLGPASTVDSLEIRWPSGQIDRYHNLPVDQLYQAREGSDRLAAIPSVSPRVSSP